MPRARKTQSGERALPIQSVPGRRYGEGVASAELQRAMPTPARAASVSPAMPAIPAETPAPAPVAPAEAPAVAVDPAQQFAAQLAAAKGVSGAGLLAQPTERPNEPVTTGMRSGPGGGPEMLGPISASPARRFYELLTQVTGDTTFTDLANRSRI